MREIHLFPGKARKAEVRATAEAAFRMPPVGGDRFIGETAESHAGIARTFGDDEAVIATDAAGFQRAVEDEHHRLHVEAVIEDPEELQAARDVMSALFGRAAK